MSEKKKMERRNVRKFVTVQMCACANACANVCVSECVRASGDSVLSKGERERESVERGG